MLCAVPDASDRQRLAARPTRRLELASALWSGGEAVYLVGLIVYAFRVGGPSAIALVALLQSLPSVVLAPMLTTATERFARVDVLRTVLAIRVVTVALAGAVLAVRTGDAAAPVVFALAAVDGLASTLLRPVRGALVPMLARSPEELVSANVAITTGMSAASLAGPAVAAVLLALGSVAAPFVLGTGAFVAALATTLRLRNVADRPTDGRDGPRGARGGFRVLRDLPAARTIVAVIVAQRFIRGMVTVLVATTALDLLHAGDEAVGILNAAIGVGGLAGSALAVGLVGRPRLAGAFGGAVALWGAALAAPALLPLLVPAAAFLAMGGVGKALIEVAGASLLQRTVPSAARSQVLGLLESFVTAALAVGAVTASLLVDRLGPAGALLAAGACAVAIAVVTWPALRRVDDAAVIPARELALLRGVDFFRPLQLTTIEDLAGRLVNVRVPAGGEVIRQGGSGDRFYIIESGVLETQVDGEHIRDLHPGHSFGEIALLRSVPRTATVVARTDASLVALARDDFLDAVSGHTESAMAAEAVVHSRVGSPREATDASAARPPR